MSNFIGKARYLISNGGTYIEDLDAKNTTIDHLIVSADFTPPPGGTSFPAPVGEIIYSDGLVLQSSGLVNVGTPGEVHIAGDLFLDNKDIILDNNKSIKWADNPFTANLDMLRMGADNNMHIGNQLGASKSVILETNGSSRFECKNTTNTSNTHLDMTTKRIDNVGLLTIENGDFTLRFKGSDAIQHGSLWLDSTDNLHLNAWRGVGNAGIILSKNGVQKMYIDTDIFFNDNACFDNNLFLQWKDFAGVQRQMMRLDTADDLIIGAGLTSTNFISLQTVGLERMRITNAIVSTTVPIDFDGNSASSSFVPVLGNHLVNKTYVDSLVPVPTGHIYFSCGVPIGASLTRYFFSSASATESENECVVATTSTLSSVHVTSFLPPTVGESFTYTLRKNEVDTLMTGSINNVATTVLLATAVAVSPFDRLSMKIVTSAGAQTTTHMATVFYSY